MYANEPFDDFFSSLIKFKKSVQRKKMIFLHVGEKILFSSLKASVLIFIFALFTCASKGKILLMIVMHVEDVELIEGWKMTLDLSYFEFQ